MSDHESLSYTISINPVTGEELGRTRLNTVNELPQMVRTARAAQKAWARLTVKKRRLYFYNVLYYLVKHVDELTEVIARDTGKLRMDALSSEILAMAVATRYYCRKAPEFLKDRRLAPSSLAFINKVSKERRVPYGVVGIISPWNYPFNLPFSEIIIALLSGNAVIVKAASETQMVSRALQQVFAAAELPDGLLQFINLPGREAGPAFVQSGMDKLFFTGSVAVGKTLMRLAAETLTPLNLELGGNDPMIVCADANLERAANGAIWAGLSNTGQSCGGVERVYVQEAVYNEFLGLLKARVEKLRVGYDTDFNVDMGAMATERQIRTVQDQIDQALSKGATILARSAVPEDPNLKNFIPAMVLTDVTHEMDIMREETFGPVLGVMKFSDEKEALQLANNSNLGLSASVWSRDRAKARRLAKEIRAGAVNINDHLMSHAMAETPWGGFKQSGIGRMHGKHGFMEMTRTQVIVDDYLGRLNNDLWWPPYDRKAYQGIKGALNLLYGEGLINRMVSLLHLLKIVPRLFAGGSKARN